jgi:hypothetical protein
MLRRAVIGLTLAALPLLGACRIKLPAEPSELTEGIVIFQDVSYMGASAHVTKDIADLQDYGGPCKRQELELGNWGVCISSIRVAPGWRATVYTEVAYSGQFLNVVEDTPDMMLVNGDCKEGGLNDCILSIRLSAPTASSSIEAGKSRDVSLIVATLFLR